MITGFEIFEPRNRNERPELEELENEYKIKLPPIFRSFVKHFRWKKELIENEDFWFTGALNLGEFNFRCKTLEQHFRFTFEIGDEEILEREFLLLAASSYSVFLGTKGNEVDKIIMGTGSTKGDYMIVAENIFDFLECVTTDVGEFASSEDEYVKFLKELGYAEDELEHEVNYWQEHYN